MSDARAVLVVDGASDAMSEYTSLLELTTRSLSHVLGLFHWQLRADTPLADLGCDSVALLVFCDVAEALAVRIDPCGLRVDNDRLALAQTVGELADALAFEDGVSDANQATVVADGTFTLDGR